MRVSCVVPVYNSAATLERLVTRIVPALDRATDTWELILVNDGSRDRSWDRIVALAGADLRIRGLDLSGNYGQHNALMAGIHASAGEVVVTLDDDLQHPPEEIPKLLGRLGSGADVVYGIPSMTQQPRHRRLAGRTQRVLLSALERSRAARLATGFRAIRGELARSLDPDQGPRLSLDILLREATDRFAAVEVRHEPRAEGRSNYTTTKLLRLALHELGRTAPLLRRVPRRQPSFSIERTTQGSLAAGPRGRP